MDNSTMWGVALGTWICIAIMQRREIAAAIRSRVRGYGPWFQETFCSNCDVPLRTSCLAGEPCPGCGEAQRAVNMFSVRGGVERTVRWRYHRGRRSRLERRDPRPPEGSTSR